MDLQPVSYDWDCRDYDSIGASCTKKGLRERIGAHLHAANLGWKELLSMKHLETSSLRPSPPQVCGGEGEEARGDSGETRPRIGGQGNELYFNAGERQGAFSPELSMMNLQNRLVRLGFALAVAMAAPGAAWAAERVKSPDGKVAVEFLLEADGAPAYKIGFFGKPVVLESRLGFEPGLTNGFHTTKSSSGSHRGQWTNNFGERKIVPDNYGELDVELKQTSGAQMRITFRAYNEGAAFRYSFPAQNGAREFVFTEERTEFRFAPDTMGYEEHGTEGEYARARIADIQPWCERPLTLEFTNGLFASLTEADNENYPRLLLSGLPGAPGALVSALGGSSANNASSRPGRWPARVAAGAATPWRTLIVGEKPGDLLERNYLLHDLVPPAALPDTSWIKPGKVMRDTALTTSNSEAIIDFAEKGGLQYVSLDTRWYGAENQTGDATTVRAPNLDLPEIIRHGSGKNVGVILYVDRQQIKKQRDILFPLYEKWGVKGVKIGFIDVGPQEETAWVTETVQKAAEHHLMLNIHDGYRSMGLGREYPNLLTVEGIRGNEHFPTPEHNCTVPFARYTAGPADYTVCYYDKRIKTTHAHQLAMAVVSFSPLQWIFWYDRPALYQGEPEIEFFQKVPTVWDDTKVINGEIGKFATIARRHGDDWFIGTINNSQARELKVPLAFLNKGWNYVAHIYADDDTVATKTKVGVKTLAVTDKSVLDAALGAGGGQAVWIASEQKPGR
jgi:alpha-glucosidase